MVRWLMLVVVGVAVTGSSLVTAWGQEGVKEEKFKKEAVTMDQVPAPVKDAITKEAGGNQVKSIVLVTKGDQKRYEAEFTADGKEIEINVDADGKLTEKEVVVAMDQVPAPVKDAITKEAGANKVDQVEEVTAGDQKCYEAEWMVNGKAVEIRVGADGKLMSKEVEE